MPDAVSGPLLRQPKRSAYVFLNLLPFPTGLFVGIVKIRHISTPSVGYGNSFNQYLFFS